jgi:hypothetical protein
VLKVALSPTGEERAGRAVARGRRTCGLVRGYRFRGSWLGLRWLGHNLVWTREEAHICAKISFLRGESWIQCLTTTEVSSLTTTIFLVVGWVGQNLYYAVETHNNHILQVVVIFWSLIRFSLVVSAGRSFVEECCHSGLVTSRTVLWRRDLSRAAPTPDGRGFAVILRS